MTNPTKTRPRVRAEQKQDAIELCLKEGLSGNAVAQRLGLMTPPPPITRPPPMHPVGYMFWGVASS